MTQFRTPSRNASIGFLLGALVFLGVGLAYAAVPLYQLFCQVTGFGGTTQVSKVVPDTVLDRKMAIRFNADIDPALPWSFQPVQREVTVRVGESSLIFYRVTNHGSTPVVGTATFNVTPHKAGSYFDKVECFCFTEQRLAPGETAELPVSFFIDPDIVKDRKLDDVSTITLSYTFFRSQTHAALSGAESAGAASASVQQSVSIR